MIILESGNRILADTVRTVVLPDPDKRPQPFEIKFCDFDGASFNLNVPDKSYSEIQVSLSLPCYAEVKDHGAQDAVEAAYPGMVASTPLQGYDVTLNIPSSYWKGQEEKAIENIASFKRYALGGVFHKYCSAVREKKIKDLPLFKFNIRPDTVVYLVPGSDRVTVFYQLRFIDKSETEIGRVFLSEFTDPAIRRKVNGAPTILFNVNTPSEIKSVASPTVAGDLGFVSITCMEQHCDNRTINKVVDSLQTFRSFVQYHIKCAKSYFHSRMRMRVVELVKVLNRAKTQPIAGAAKMVITATGKTVLQK